jgi:RNA polymerase sigma-70 factor, ECF subfamily
MRVQSFSHLILSAFVCRNSRNYFHSNGRCQQPRKRSIMCTKDELIRSAVAGDKVALQSLLLIHYPANEATIRQNLGPNLAAKLEVQDLMQEVLVAAYQHIKGFSSSDAVSFPVWLNRIAANRVIDAARKHGRIKRGGKAVQLQIHRLADESLDNVWDWVFADSNPPDRPVRIEEAREAVQVCLARLAEDQREAVFAHYFEHKDTQEIAERMARTPGAVRELLRRARANLANDLGAASKWLSSR